MDELRSTQGWIFDLDGTLVKTQAEFHAPAEAAILAKCGITVRPEEISKRFAGVHTLEVFRQLAPRHDPHELLEEKWRRMHLMARARTIEPVDYARKLLQQLRRRGIPMGIASASPLTWIELCMATINADRYMHCYASVDEVESGKPSPDVFLLAANRLECAPRNCIAVEDGEAGVRAALAAEMRTYWLTNTTQIIEGAHKIHWLKQLLV